MNELMFGSVKPGELWGNEEYDWKLQKSVGRADALWIVADYTHNHNGSQDRIVAHFFDHSENILYLYKIITEDGWYSYGYEDGEFERFDEHFGLFYLRSLMDHVFTAGTVKVGKTYSQMNYVNHLLTQ